MKREELETRFIQEQIPSDLFHLYGGYPNESFCLNFNGKDWEVDYSERGLKTGFKTFNYEEEACEYLYNLITRNRY